MTTDNVQVYEEQGGAVLVEAQGIHITDAASRATAAEFGIRTRRAVRAVEEELKPAIGKAYSLHKDLVAQMKRLIAPFKSAQLVVDAEIVRDHGEQERLARVEARRVAEEEAEQERVRLEAEALVLVVEDDTDAAVEVLEQAEAVVPMQVAPAPVAKTTHTALGTVTTRKVLTVECTDKAAVVRAVAAGTMPLDFIIINAAVAKRHIIAGNLTQLAGFDIGEKVVVAGRG